MDSADIAEVADLLTRRRALLRVLQSGPASKRDLRTSLDVSRSTVDRAIRTLESAGIVERSGGEVALTLFGRLVFEGFSDFWHGLEGLSDAEPLLTSLDQTVDVPFALFDGAMVVTATRESPHRPIIAFEQFLTDASRVWSIGTGLVPDFVDEFREQIVDQGTEAELVIYAPVLNDLLSTYWEPVDEALDTGRLTIYETTTVPPFSLKLADTGRDEVAFLVYGDQGVNGFVRSDGETAVEWARAEYERVKADAQRVTPSR